MRNLIRNTARRFPSAIAVLVLILFLLSYPFVCIREGFAHIRAEHKYFWSGGFRLTVRESFAELKQEFSR